MKINIPQLKFFTASVLVILSCFIGSNTYAQAPTITTQPTNDTACAGNNAGFSVTATNATSYQWELSTNGGSTWSNVPNSSPYSGTTTASLSISATTAAMHDYRYRCVVTGSSSPAATSNAAILKVNGVISTTGATVCAGTPAQVSASLTAGTTNTWYSASSGGTVLGTGTTLSISNPTATTTYYAQAAGSGGTPTPYTHSTPYNTNNGQRGAMFDVQTGSSAITVTHFDCNLYSGTTANYEIYYRAGTHVGFENNSAAWTYLGGATSVTSLGNNVATPLPIYFSVTIPANTRYSFYITNDFGGGTSYTDGTAVGNYLSGNTDLTVYEGVGKSYPFGLTFTVRNINATIHYTKGGSCLSTSRVGATVTVNPTAAVTANPANSSITSGSNTSFGITATTATGYQWQVSTNSGSTWNNVTNTGIYTNATTATLNLTGATSTQNNYQYRCIAINSSGCNDTSTSATLTITGSAPVVITHPVSTTICDGGNTSFGISATGTSLTYQWQVSTNNGSTWNNLSNTGIYSGTTTNNLTLTSVNSSYNTYQYRCVVTGSVSPAATSNTATLTVNSSPSITTNPVNSTICAGSNTSFTVAANGAGLTYQWQVSTNSGSTWSNVTNTGIYSGATTNTLSLTAATTANNTNQYRCIVSGACTPAATSNVATLIINTAPAISVQPVNSAICDGSNTSFSVTATGSGLTYQWQVSTNSGSTWSNVTNTGIYSGATTNTLSLTAATTTNNTNQYRCIVSGACTPAATSNAATLIINTAPAISVQPVNSAICDGSNTSFSVTATGLGLTYQWQVSTNSGSTWSNVTNTGIYSGATTNTLSLTAATTANNTNQYRCVVSGACTPPTTSTAGTLTINSLPSISVHPTNSTIGAGSNTSFSVTATGTSLTYQWQVSTNSGSTWSNLSNTGIYSGINTATLNLTATTATYNAYQYRCTVSGACTPAATSNAAILTVNSAPAITVQPTNQAVCNGGNTSFAITATNATGYQWEVSTNGGSTWSSLSNTGIYSGASTNTLLITGASTAINNNQYRCVVSGAAPPDATSNAATLTINTAPVINTHPVNNTICAGSNTSFSVAATGTGLTYQWEVSTNGGSTWSNVSNTGIYSGAITSTLNLTVATSAFNSNQYRCIVGGTCTPATTSNTATLTVNTAPAITTHPANSTICNGNNTMFNVTATGTGLTYQWQVSSNGGSTWSNLSNTGIYSGVATNSLSLTAATTTNNANQYRCLVSGTCTPVFTSNVATLTINTAPAITLQPTNTTTCDGSNASFGVTATGTGLTYQWEVSTNGGSTWSNVSNTGVYSGATSATLDLTSISVSFNAYQYRCVVSGTCTPSVTSTAATLNVNSTLNITNQPNNSVICAGNNTSFTVVASASGLGYQWQLSINGGSTWSNLSNNTIYSGVTTATLSVSNTTTTLNNNWYRCVLSSTCASPVNSNVAILTVNVAPAINTQPVASTICLGSNTSFSVSATGSGITYQWEVSTNGGSTWSSVINNTVFTGATTNTLNLTAPSVALNGHQYRCVVGGSCVPGVTSSEVLITINEQPAITTQPAASIICSGNNTSFSIAATGTSLVYQWQVSTNGGSTWSNVINSTLYSGATTNTLNLTAATTAEDGNMYRCNVSGVCTPAVVSGEVALTVNTAPAINTQPIASTICLGSNTSFSISATGTGITYQWEVSANGGSTWSSVINNTLYSGATTNTLNLTAPAVALNGHQYRCVVGGSCVPGVTSSEVLLTINEQPTITTQPIASVICSGSNTSFSISATGTSLLYQWQVSTNGGSTWSNVINSALYSGATTNTLNLTAATTAEDGNMYRCNVSGVCTPAVVTGEVALTVNTSPSINSQPVSSIICYGSNTSFVVVATGTSLTYQWEVNDGNGWANVVNTSVYSGATTSTLSLTGAPIAYTGYQYRCVIGGACVPGVISSIVNLTVNSLPAITAQPSNSTICSGNNTSFNISATGTALAYQWEVSTDGGNIWNSLSNTGIYSGVTTNTLSLTTATTAANNNMYRCLISGTCTPSVTSNEVILVVNTAPAISVQPMNSTICEGANTSFSITAGGTGINYQWEVNTGSGWNNVTNAGIYTGATTNTLNLTGATVAQQSYQYRCLVQGVCTPAIVSDSALLTINTPPVVTNNPTNSIICEGDNTSFSIAATGTNITYQWQVSTNGGGTWNNVVNSSVYANATTNTLNITAATAALNNYQYRCIVSGTCTPVAFSSLASLTVNTLPAVVTQPVSSTVCEGSNTLFSVSATGTGWTCQWQVSTNSGGTWSNLSNTGIYSGTNTNSLGLTAVTASMSSYQYRCVVSGTCAPAVYSNAVALTVQLKPVITTQPSSKTICEGLNHSFSLSATGTGLTYQWQVNTGSGFNNLTNSGVYTNVATNTLTLSNIPPSFNNNQYRCVVTGACSPVAISSAATLVVNTNPIIATQPVNKTICSGDITGFSVNATGTGLTYQWWSYNGSSWSALTNGGIYSGTTTSTLSVNGPQAPTTAITYRYYCHIAGTCASINTDTSDLVIQAKPKVTLHPSNVAVCDSTTSITFSISATGTNVSYQWQTFNGTAWVNLTNAGLYSGVNTTQLQISQVYYSMDSKTYRCIVSGTCAPAAPSSYGVLTVYPLKKPILNIVADNDDICVGTKVVFTPIPTNGGNTPGYQWLLNGNPAGTGNTYSSTTLSDQDEVLCVMTSSYVCPRPLTDTSNKVIMKVTPYSHPTITINTPEGNMGCLGRAVNFSAQTTFAGATPTFAWQVNGVAVGNNADTFQSYNILDGDEVKCIFTSSIKCPDPKTQTSNIMTMDMIPVTKASIVIVADPDTIVCKQTQVTMHSWYSNGGVTPKYQWLLNGQDIPGETMGTMKISGLSDLDNIQCRFSSSARCVFPEISNVIDFEVVKDIVPKVDVAVYSLGDNKFMFEALPVNGGASPKYQWYNNGKSIYGANDSIYIASNLQSHEKITVQMFSSYECATLPYVMSRNITTGVVALESFDTLNLYPNPNLGTFRIKGDIQTQDTEMQLLVLNALGQVVHEQVIETVNGKVDGQVELGDKALPGNYILRISNSKSEQKIIRFIINR